MCGIFGIVLNNNNENIYNLIINGLIQLQNRGYDSAGICMIKNNKIYFLTWVFTDRYLEINL